MNTNQIKLEDYGKIRKVTIQQWIKDSGVCNKALFTKEELLPILEAYRAFVYEAEFRPQVTYNNGEEIPFNED